MSNTARYALPVIEHLPRPVYRRFLRSKILLKVINLFGITPSAADFSSFERFDNTSVRTCKNAFLTRFDLAPQVPALVIYAPNDPFIKSTAYELLQLADVSKHRKVLITSGGHFGTTEGRLKALEEIANFISEKANPDLF
jgi:pimeloyl-ACP methyl ester carboxylesterase